MGHRPMYCSNADLDDCTWHESKVRTPPWGGVPGARQGGVPSLSPPFPSLCALPRFAKASVASSMGWRIFSTNMVSDLGTPTPPPNLSRIRQLDPNLFCFRG